MSACLLVNRDLSLKENLKRALITNLSKEEWMSEFYSSDFIFESFLFKHFITHADKVQIIEELLASGSPFKDQLEVVKETLKSKAQYYNLLVVRRVEGVKYKDLSGIRKSEFFKVHPLRPSQFIPILSPQLNNVMFGEIQSTFFAKTIWDRLNKLLVVDDVDLNRSLRAYRVELLQQLFDWIKSKNLMALPGITRPQVTMTDSAFLHVYHNILKEAWNLISGMLDSSLVINDHESASVLHNKVRPITAFYLLLNFDECVSAFSNGTITIKTEYNQKSNLNLSDKYFRLKQENLPGDFADAYKDVDGDKLTSNLLVSFVQTVKLPNGKTLTKEFLNKLVIAMEQLFEYNHGQYRKELVDIVYGKNLTEKERLLKLAELLRKNTYFTSKTSSVECEALANALEEYYEAYENTIAKKATSLKARLALPETYNILQQLFSHMTKSVMTYASVDGHGDLKQKTAVNYSRSKKSVWGSIESGLEECLRKGMIHFFEEGFTVNGSSLSMITTIKDLTTQDILRRMTGLAFNTKTMLEAFSTPENLKILGDFMTKYCQIVSETVTYEESISPTALENTIATVMKKLKSEPAYVAFSDLFVEGDSSYTIKLLDLSGNAIPIVGTHTTISSHWLNMEDVLESFPEIAETNIQFKHKNIVSLTGDIDTKDGNRGLRSSSWYSAHIIHATDVEVNGNVVRYSKLSPKRLAQISIFSEYMRSVVEGGIMLTQIEAFSDKIRIAKGAFNIGATDLMSQSPEELVKLAYLQHQGYYQAISRQVCQLLSEVFGFPIQDLWQADRILRNTTEELFRLKLLEYQRRPDAQPINILRDIHFSRFGDGKLGINPMLLKEVERSKDDIRKWPNISWLKEYKENYDAFRRDLIAEGVEASEYEFNYHQLSDSQKDTLLKMFGVKSYTDLPDFSKLTGKTWDYFFKKYFALTVLTRESDLQISLKHYWAHDKVSNGFKNKTPDLLKRAVQVECGTVTNASTTEIEEIKAAFARENTTRGNKSKKRYNAGPASYTGWDLGTKYGLPDTINIAHIEHARLAVWNYFGNFNDDRIDGSESLNSHDGATFSTTVCRTLERSSASNRKVSSTLKTITLQPSGAGFMQIKTADFEMNNAWVRWTKKMGISPDPNFENFDGVEILYKMFSPAKVTPEFVTNWIENIKAGRKGLKLGYDFLYMFFGKHASLVDLKVDDEGGLDFIWKYDDGTIVPKNDVQRHLYDAGTRAKLQITSLGNILINNFSLFELWLTFGGAYCMSTKEDGTLGYSDASQEVLAGLMSEFDTTGLMKRKMIYKITDEESSKSSQGVVNKKAQLANRDTNNDFVVNYIDSSRYGIQQDYGHEADGSKIPMLTQVLTAIAFNGENTPLVQHAYEVLGQIVEESLKKVTSKWEMDPIHRTTFHKEMGKQLLKQLETNSVASNASDIIKALYEDMQKWGKDHNVEIAPIPYSDPQLFYLASSHLITRLNRESLKHKFEGIAVVQNPANGIVSIYEDVNGVQYTATDITELSNEWFRQQREANPTFGDDWLNLSQEIINTKYLYSQSQSGGLFASEEVTINNFNILGVGDVVEDSNGNSYIINDPIEFRALYDQVKAKTLVLYKVRNKPRDLAVTKITWNPTTATRLGKNVGTPGNFWLLDSTQLLVALAKENANRKKGQPKKRDINLEKWHAANLRGLAEEVKPYIYLTKEDWIKGIKTFINSKVLKKGGEEILPKQYKTLLGLRHSMSYIKTHPDYFLNLAEQKYDLNKHIDKGTLSATDVAFIKENYDIIVTSTTAPDSPSTEWRMRKIGTETHWTLVDLRTNREFDGIDFIGPKPDFIVDVVTYGDGSKPTLYFHTLGIATVSWLRFNEGVKEGLHNIISQNPDVQKFVPNKGLSTDELIKIKSAQLRTSFEMSCLTISARIPSQSFQSFLANETVGYTESDVNDGYMNIWEMWFLGSDYDIDKAYTMMYGLDSTGAIAGNIFTRDCRTTEGVQKSLLLPTFSRDKASSKKVVMGNEAVTSTGLELANVILDAYKIETDNALATIQEAIAYMSNPENEGFYFRAIEYALTRDAGLRLSDNSLGLLSEDLQAFITNIATKLNTYLSTPESIDATKNRIVAAIRHASSDLRNLKASEVPMEAGDIGARIEERAKGKLPAYHNYNPFTLWRIQKENAVGKDDVGIAANGLKAAGAIQQYFDNAYRTTPQVGPDGTISAWDIPKININLDFSISDAPNIRYRFRRYNNTKVTNSAQLEYILGGKAALTEQPTYEYFAQIINNPNWLDIANARLSDSTIRHREARFWGNVIAYYDKHSLLNPGKPIIPSESDFIEITFEEMETEPNVADILSVFISLATDNAKELKLSKMNGRPELLSIPIAMATLGMEADDMIDICVELLDSVGKEIDKADGGYVNIREIIANDSTLSESNKTSLLALYDFAQELRALTSFFSVNLGVKAKLTELREFLNGLSRLKIQAEKTRRLTSSPMSGKLDFKQLVLKLGPDGQRSDYQKGLVAHYESLKSGINVMDVIISSPHFRAQLESISETVEIIEKSTGKGRILKMLSEHTDAFDFKGMGKLDRIDATNRAIRMVDSYILEDAFSRMKHLQFSKLQLIADYPDYDPTINDLTTVGTQNMVQMKGLLQFVEHSLVPKLQSLFPDNFFLLNLTPNKDALTGATYLHLPFNLFATDESMYVAESVNMAMAGFEEIAKYASGIKDLNGQDVSIGEFLYLYSLITSRNSISSMMTCTYSGVSKYSDLPLYIEKAYRLFDLIAQNCNIAENADEMVAEGSISEEDKQALLAKEAEALQKFNKIVSGIYPYVYALAHKGSYDMAQGKMITIEKELQKEVTPVTDDTEAMSDIMNGDLNMHFSSKEFFLPTMDKGYSWQSFSSSSFGNEATLKKITDVVTMRLAAQLGLTVEQIRDIYKINVNAPVSRQLLDMDGRPTGSYLVQLKIDISFVNDTDGKEAISFMFTGEDTSGNLYMKNVEEQVIRIAANLKTPTRILQDKGLSGEIHRNVNLRPAGIATTSANPNVESFLHRVNEFLTNDKDIVLKHNGRPSVHYINDLKIYIVGQQAVSDSDAVRMYLMDLGFLSENAQLIALMLQILPDLNIYSIEDVLFALKQPGVLEEIKNSSSIIREFIENIYENPATEYIKQLANIQLSKYLTALFAHRSIYFGDPEITDRIGDIYKDNDGDLWIHLLSDEDNHPVLVRFDGLLARPETEKEVVKPIYGTFKGFTKVNSLAVPNTYILRSISPSDFSYQEEVEYQHDEVSVGDIIKTASGRSYFVQDIIHRRSNNGLSKHLVVAPLDNTKKKIKLELKDPYSSEFVTRQTPEVTTDITYERSKSAKKIDIRQLSENDKKFILMKMSEGQEVWIGNEKKNLKTVIDNYIVTVNNEQYSISDVSEVYVESLEHIGFNLLSACSQTPQIIVDSKEFANYPEFRTGYVELKTAKRNRGESNIIVRAKGKEVSGIKYLGFNTDSLHLMPDSEIYRIGDIIFFEDKKGPYELAQVVSVEGNQLSLMVVRHLASGEVQYTSRNINVTEAKNGIHYRKTASITPPRINILANALADTASMSLKGKRMLEYLGDKFNTTVEIISDSSQDFVARVDNGKVVINVAKKPSSESVERFIATLAIHEFTHLMLAYLRALKTDIYLSIMRNVNPTLTAEELGTAYSSEILRLEEILVRLITSYAEAGLPSKDLSALDITYLFTKIVNAFLGVKGKQGNLILKEQMIGTSSSLERTKAYKFFEFLQQEGSLDNWRMDVNLIQHQILLDDIIDNIMKCKS